VILKTLLRQGISQPGFYGDVIYKLRKILGHVNFSAVFTKIIKRFIIPRRWNREGDIVLALSVRPSVRISFPG
jgi:hypothetical protein